MALWELWYPSQVQRLFGKHLAGQRQNWAKVCANILADGEHIPELSPGPVNVLMCTKPIMPSALDKCLIKDRSSV